MSAATLYRRPGDRHGRLWVGLMVTQGALNSGSVDALTPGLKLFTGMWYGDDPTDPNSFGKMVENRGAVPVGTVSRRSSHATLKRLGHQGRRLRKPGKFTAAEPL